MTDSKSTVTLIVARILPVTAQHCFGEWAPLKMSVQKVFTSQFVVQVDINAQTSDWMWRGKWLFVIPALMCLVRNQQLIRRFHCGFTDFREKADLSPPCVLPSSRLPLFACWSGHISWAGIYSYFFLKKRFSFDTRVLNGTQVYNWNNRNFISVSFWS